MTLTMLLLLQTRQLFLYLCNSNSLLQNEEHLMLLPFLMIHEESYIKVKWIATVWGQPSAFCIYSKTDRVLLNH